MLIQMQVPFTETDRVDAPASLYAATKRSCELLASVYHNIYNVSVTGLRFFTVYGPWGRPDMAALAFSHKIADGHPVKIFKGPGDTELARDFTYIDDIVNVRAFYIMCHSCCITVAGCGPLSAR
jgi:UDP-glucuronate 4-epimerase